jgi:hypothetical protein
LGGNVCGLIRIIFELRTTELDIPSLKTGSSSVPGSIINTSPGKTTVFTTYKEIEGESETITEAGGDRGSGPLKPSEADSPEAVENRFPVLFVNRVLGRGFGYNDMIF